LAIKNPARGVLSLWCRAYNVQTTTVKQKHRSAYDHTKRIHIDERPLVIATRRVGNNTQFELRTRKFLAIPPSVEIIP
jgi:hypothetical protein